MEARAQAGIRRYMSLRRITDDKIAVKQNVQTRTIQNRIKDPGSMQLRDLWDLAEILNAPVGELAGGDLPEEMLAKLIQMETIAIIIRALYVVYLTANHKPPILSASGVQCGNWASRRGCGQAFILRKGGRT